MEASDGFETIPDSLKSVGLRPVFVMRLEVAKPIPVGFTPSGDRRIGVVTGGRFEGDRLRGVVLDGGSDWQILRQDKALTLNVRLVLKTDDEALITMTYRGIRHGPPEITEKIGRGEEVSAESYYFRTSATFETSAERYDWLNRILAIGAGHRERTGPVYSLFEIL